MTDRAMFEASFKRPSNFFRLPEAQQWQIDNNLGILDWDGTDLTEAERQRYKEHYR